MKDLEALEILVLEYLEGEMTPEQEQSFLAEAANDPQLAALLDEYQQQERALQAYFSEQSTAADHIAKPQLETLPVAVVAAPRQRSTWIAAVAASVALVTLGGGYIALKEEKSAAPATVLVAEGRPVAVTDSGMVPITPANPLPANLQRVKTPAGSYLQVALQDGAGQLELNSNTAVRLGRALELERGEVIVHATRPATESSRSATTIHTPYFDARSESGVFNVVRGLRGAEVSVVSGEVEVVQSGSRRVLKPGETFSSTGARPLPIVQRIAWSPQSEELARALPASATTTTSHREVASAATYQNSTTLPQAVLKSTGEDAPASPAIIASSGIATTDYLPEQTFGLLEIRDLSRVFDEKSFRSLNEFLANGEFRDAVIEIQRGMNIPQAEAEAFIERFDTTFQDGEVQTLLSALRGSLSVSLHSEGPLLVAELTNSEEQVKSFVDNRLDPYFAETITVASRPRAAVENGFLVLGANGERFDLVVEAIRAGQPTPFAGSPFISTLRNEVGTSHFTAATNIAPLLDRRDTRTMRAASRFGIANLSAIIASTNFTDQADNRALRFIFDGQREGVMSWLDEPGPFGSIQFYSPDTHFLMTARIKRPQQMLEQMFGWIAEDRPGAAVPQTPEGLQLLADIAATLGNEVAFGVDNPILPRPNVKLAMEVIDPVAFHNGMLALLEELDASTPSSGEKLDVRAQDYKGHLIVDFQYPGSLFPVSYAIIEDYVVFSPGRPFLETAVDLAASNRGLDREYAFQQALPAKSGSHASFLMYISPNRLQEAVPYLGAMLDSNVQQAIAHQQARVGPQGGSAEIRPTVVYGIADDRRIDFYIEGVRGEFEMGNMLPVVADWLGVNSTLNQ